MHQAEETLCEYFDASCMHTMMTTVMPQQYVQSRVIFSTARHIKATTR